MPAAYSSILVISFWRSQARPLIFQFRRTRGIMEGIASRLATPRFSYDARPHLVARVFDVVLHGMAGYGAKTGRDAWYYS